MNIKDIMVGGIYKLGWCLGFDNNAKTGTKVKVLEKLTDENLVRVMELTNDKAASVFNVFPTIICDIKFKTGDIVELYKSVFKPNPKAGAHIPLTFVRYTEPKTYEIYLNDKFYDYCHSDCIVKTKDGKEIPGYSPNLKLLDPCLVERHEEVIKCYRDGMRTVVKYYENGQHIGTGCALCDYSDEYDYATGKKLALKRLSDNISKREFKVVEKPNPLSRNIISTDNSSLISGKGNVTLDDFTPNKCKISVGDVVKVIDSGSRYDTYIEWFVKYKLYDLLARYQYNSNFAPEINIDIDTFIVKAVGEHLTDDKNLLAIEDCYHRVYLIDEKGVKRIDK